MNTITGYAMTGVEKANQMLTERRAVQGQAGLTEGTDFKRTDVHNERGRKTHVVRLLSDKAKENPLAVVYHYDSFPFGGNWSRTYDTLRIQAFTD